MTFDWVDIEGQLQLLAPLHVGSGLSAEFFISKSVSDAGSAPDLALTMTDVAGNSAIPGSTLKGALRAAVVQGSGLSEHSIERLFGKRKTALAVPKERHQAEGITAGSLQFFAARVLEPSHLGHAARGAGTMPASQCSDGSPMAEKGLEVVSRTAINSDLGVALEHRLFHEQVVSPGAVFKLRMRLHLGTTEPELAFEEIQALIAPFAAKNGLSLGRGSTYGRGRLRLVDNAIRVALKRGRSARPKDKKVLPIAPPTKNNDRVEYLLRLSCEGPFITIDNVATQNQTAGGASDDDHLPQIIGMERGDEPVLTGETLYGALRQRANWLARIKDSEHRNNRFVPMAKGKTAPPEQWIDRLFGRAGWRGMLHVDEIILESGSDMKNISSVKIDRFSGAPIDGGLFTTSTYLDPVFLVRLSLRDRNGALESAKDEFASLIKDLEDNGLELGHGAAKGFGWFAVQCANAEEDAE